MNRRLQRAIPFLGWIGTYPRKHLSDDITAGLTTAVMLIPQAMAYAMLAGLPPIVGLYASTLPLVVYSLMGSSRELAVGPVAMVSLLVATALTPLAEAGSPDYVAYAIVLALLVGVMQLAMGLLRAGFLVNFLSHPVVSGFTSAAALIIGFSQLKHLLGVNIPRSHHVHTIVIAAVQRVSEIEPVTFVIGAGSIAALMAMKRYVPRWPRALIVVAVATTAVWLFGLQAHGVSIVGDVPAGLPDLAMPKLSGDRIGALLPTAIIISLVGFMESISVAKAFASRGRYQIDANQELVGLGLANVAAGVFGGYPVTGGFSRTAVNAQAGARSSVAGLVAAGIVILTLLLLTDLFFYLPNAVLAAVIMTAVFGLVDLHEVAHLWRVDRADLALLALTFVATLLLGIEAGIGLGVGASLLWFVVRTTRPHTAVLGRIPDTTQYRNVDRFPEAIPTEGVLVVRLDASFYFGNVQFLEQTLARLLAADPDVHTVVIDASSINRLDSSADTALHAIADDLQTRGIALALAGTKGPVRDTMARSGLAARLGAAATHLSVHDAVLAAGRRGVGTSRRAC
jgi:SulP family sulfate permease